ncbi:fumarylacetoacetate hydrolase family protein [Actinospica sp. MGRD01-02]|uniref:Fumarylacetoacetate hydrolase family protein n=1 Tax=Actinospica acidithermotolerans TaxID=2828514 RepID=A0A941EIS8_9ACTN|nr:fumarylacetoacetate hydrolase family protein [Actinospica acidithermotolerans]MBR7828409.1 fumarylacetoacetate hydrolase family protein [Actinospica acidithermotolerans]
MRWARTRYGGHTAFAIVEDEELVLVHGSPFGEYQRSATRLPLAGAALLPPVIPPTFYAVGFNYVAHNAEASARVSSVAIPKRPEVGYRAQSALIGHGEAVVKPADCTGPFEAEAELVAVIGRDVRRCSRDEAQASVFGWTIGNDVSARTWQRADRTLWRAKNSDTFKPMGPWIETDADPLGATTTVTLDGDKLAEFPTGGMLFDPYDYICAISRYITLRAGDVIWMGTDAMVEMPVGHTLGIEITGIGSLANPVTEESAP